MSARTKVPFGDLLLDSKDGEWGAGAPGVGLLASDMIRGTDFAELNSPAKELPRRYVNERHVTRKRLQVGDIVFEMAGGTAKQSTGRSALITQVFLERRYETPVLCASFCRHLRLDQSRYDPKFVYYLLQALYEAGYMSVFNIQHTGVSRFQYTSFKKHTVLDVPELATQQKIAAILSAYDDLIANNQRRITLLERMAEDIYREWFVRLRFPGHELGKIEKGVPQGWRAVCFSEICRFEKGKNPATLFDAPADGTLPYLNVETLEKASASYAPRTKNAVVCSGDDVLMLMDGARSGFVFRGQAGIVSSTFALVRTESKFKNVVFEYLKAGKDAVVFNNTGSAIPHANKEFINRMTMFLPTDDTLVNQFNDQYQHFFQQAQNLAQQNSVLTQTRDALLPRLISGKLAVDGLDIRFPPGMAPMGSRIPTPETAAAMAEAREMGPARFGNGRELVASLDQKIGKSKARAPNEPT